MIDQNNDYYIDMFKIPLIHISSNNWVEKKQFLNTMMKAQEIKNIDFIKTSYYGQKPESVSYLCKRISTLFKDELKKYLEITGLKDYQVNLAWFQQQDKNMFHEIHNHGLGISVVCYLEYNPEIHTPTHFISPYNNLLGGGTEYFTPPDIEEGSIIFFPAMLNHYTLPNKSDTPRKIVSWNMSVS
jgi:hypothetical protein